MSEMAIQAENLSKLYHIGMLQQRHDTLRDLLVDSLKAPLRQFRRNTRPGIHDSSADVLWALRDVSFEIQQGEVVGIIGRNGAGKSTLLKILSQITEPTAGRAIINGRVSSLLEVGTGFHPELTGRENIYLNGAILGMLRTEIESKFDEIVAFSEIEKFLDTPVKRYSSGMYVRLAFSVAAHLEPEVLIVDEVLAVGDLAFQKKCLGKMDDVAKTGRTVLLVSHNMSAIQSLCQRGIFLRQGFVVADLPVMEAVSEYLRSIEESAATDLEHHTERRGKNQSRLIKVEINTGNGELDNLLITGSPARFIFHVSELLPGLQCSFNIYDESGRAIVKFSSAMHGPEDCEAPFPTKAFACELDELPLLPGRYRLNVAIEGDGELQDHVEGAAVFEVKPGALRGRAISGQMGQSRLILPHRWTAPERGR